MKFYIFSCTLYHHPWLAGIYHFIWEFIWICGVFFSHITHLWQCWWERAPRFSTAFWWWWTHHQFGGFYAVCLFRFIPKIALGYLPGTGSDVQLHAELLAQLLAAVQCIQHTQCAAPGWLSLQSWNEVYGRVLAELSQRGASSHSHEISITWSVQRDPCILSTLIRQGNKAELVWNVVLQERWHQND